MPVFIINILLKQKQIIMTQQLTTPPPYIWDRIEKILDEQESKNKCPQKVVSNSFRCSVNSQPVNYFLAVTGAGLLALIMMKYSLV